MAKIDDDNVFLFHAESVDLLDGMEESLLFIQQHGIDKEHLNAIFRAMHTIKGGASMFHFETLVELTHTAENLLDKLRTFQLEINDDMITLLLDLKDHVNNLIEDIIQNDCSEHYDDERLELNEKYKQKLKSFLDADYKPKPSVEVLEESSSKDIQKKSPTMLKIESSKIDSIINLLGEMVITTASVMQHSIRINDKPLKESIDNLYKILEELREASMKSRMVPVFDTFNKYQRVVRDLSMKLDKKIDFKIIGGDTELDRVIIEKISDPLMHLVRNSIDHGIEDKEQRVKSKKPETGLISITASHEAGYIIIKVKDDGRGLDKEKILNKAIERGIVSAKDKLKEQEIFNLILEPGFSTANEISDISGRGVGMDVVKSSIEKLGGVVEIDSDLGFGTIIKIRLPLTLAIIPSLIVIVNGRRYAVPQVNLEELVTLYDEDVSKKIEIAGNKELYRLRDTLLPMVRLSEVFERPEPFDEIVKAEITDYYKNKSLKDLEKYKKDIAEGKEAEISLSFAVLKVGGVKYGLIIDEVVGTEEIVVKPMHKAVQDLDIYSGATVLGDGEVALILDILGVSNHAGVNSSTVSDEEILEVQSSKDKGTDLLHFRNNDHEIFGLELEKIKRIEKIKIDDIEEVGGQEFITIDGKSTLIVKFENYMNVEATNLREEMFLILPQGTEHAFGILVSELIDIGLYEYELDQDSYQSEGIQGTAIIDSNMTLLVDADNIISLINPSWV